MSAYTFRTNEGFNIPKQKFWQKDKCHMNTTSAAAGSTLRAELECGLELSCAALILPRYLKRIASLTTLNSARVWILQKHVSVNFSWQEENFISAREGLSLKTSDTDDGKIALATKHVLGCVREVFEKEKVASQFVWTFQLHLQSKSKM